jgi:hypothetical protein
MYGGSFPTSAFFNYLKFLAYLKVNVDGISYGETSVGSEITLALFTVSLSFCLSYIYLNIFQCPSVF